MDPVSLADAGADSNNSETSSSEIKFAECLVQEGALLYGANWCQPCQWQKEVFREGWEIMKQNYINCTGDDGTGTSWYCQELGLKFFPHWEFPLKAATHNGPIELYQFSPFFSDCQHIDEI